MFGGNIMFEKFKKKSTDENTIKELREEIRNLQIENVELHSQLVIAQSQKEYIEKKIIECENYKRMLEESLKEVNDVRDKFTGLYRALKLSQQVSE
jgi:chromosome segregation ATPase